MKLNLTDNVCDPVRLEAFLCGDLSDVQEREFTLHLNSCETCRRALAEQAAEPEAWREAEQLLRPSQFEPGDSTNAVPDTRQPIQIQFVLDALGPTDDPAKLGRLGGYEVSGVVGAGGMGVVLKASDPSLDRTVAIKVLAPHLATSGAARKRFAREAKAAAAVLHPNVIAIHSVSNDESLPYLVMPYVRGTSLQKRLDQEGPLPLQEILRIGAQIAAGLAAAHGQGLVHRDIKPANILLEDGVERVTITDFGLARAVDDATLTHSGMIAGTPQFMSPEQARGEPVDPRSDLFSLGSVLFAICTGRPPFRAETSYGVMRRITDDEPTSIRELNPEIPEWLCQIIGKLMSKQSADRFESAAEVAELLAACLAHVQHPASAPLPPVLITPAKRRSFPLISRRTRVFVMIATLSLALLGMFAWQATEAPDIAGKWSGPEWGDVVLAAVNPGEYQGTYTDNFQRTLGTIVLKWSRLERRYKGTWREGQNRSGKLSLRLVKDEIRGAWTTSKKSAIHPGTPELADLTWTRAQATGAVLTPKQIVEQGEKLYLSRERIAVQFQVSSSSPITVTDEKGVQHEQFDLYAAEAPEFSVRITHQGLAALKAAGVKDVAKHFTGKKIKVEGTVYGVGLNLLARRDTLWTFHLDVDSLDQVSMVDLAKPPVAPAWQMRIATPEDMLIAVADERGRFDQASQHKVPARLNLAPGRIYRWKITNITGRPGLELYPTLETSETSSRTEAFLAHSAIPLRFTDEDFDQALTGKLVTKAIYLPVIPTATEAETIASTQLDPGVDPIVEAKRRGTLLVVIRLGNKDGEPSSVASSPTGLRFSEAQEVVLSMNSSKFMLDLDTGKTMGPPATIQAEHKRMDIHTDQFQPYHYPKELIGHGLRGLEVKEADWDASVTEVRRALALADVTPLTQMDLGPEQRPTYFFQTSEGTRGVLQLLGIVEEPKGIRFRYKTVVGLKADEKSDAPKLLRKFSVKHRIGALAASADGELVAIASSDVTFPLTADWKPVVNVLDAETGKTVASLSLATDEERELLSNAEGVPHFEVGPLAFSPDGKVLAVSSGLGQVKLFQARTGELIRSLNDDKAKRADKATPEKFKSLARAMGSVRSLAFSPDGALLAMAGTSFEEDGRRWGAIERGGRGERSSTSPGRLKVWDVKTGTLKHDLAGHSQAFAVAFSLDGQWLASTGRWTTSAGEGNGLLLWDLEKEAIRCAITIDANGSTHAVVFSPAKKLAAIGSIKFDKENDTRSTAIQMAYPLSGITEWQQTIAGAALPKAFLPDGKSLVALCERKSISFIDVGTGRTTHEIQAADSADGGIWIDLAVAPRAGILVIAGASTETGGSIEIWDLMGLQQK